MSVFVDIEKRLGAFCLKVKFEAGEETLALLGASGCGKSMTLKCIAGIEKPDRGHIEVDGITLFDSEKNINLPPQKRRAGLMFQNYALFPNMTVLQNICAGANREKDRKAREKRAMDMIEKLGLEQQTGHYPHQLSGGQQQRVALARLLVSDPQILLLDEPFSALDSHLRFRLEQEVRAALREYGKSVLLVSHDRDEVYRMADSIAVMNAGRVEAYGRKEDVFAAPETRMGAKLTGCKNISAIERRGEDRIYAADWGVELRVRGLSGNTKYVGIRMHDVCPAQMKNHRSFVKSDEAGKNRKDTEMETAWTAAPAGGDRNDAGAGVHRHNPGGMADENIGLYKIVDIIENPFSVTIMCRHTDKEDATPIGWETQKEVWERYKADELYLRLPRESLLLLGDGE